jgi:type III restriction enzyme
MTESFFERPILNSPYEIPRLHHALDKDGQPLDEPPVEGRRRSELITPVPKPRKSKSKPEQHAFVFGDNGGLSSVEQEYNPTPIINEIRSHVASWRDLPNSGDWSVTPTTARLLTHWRHHNYEGVRPFFCQVEAVETIIWLTEVARQQKRYAKFWEHLKGANEQANPELLRIAMKMATGSGKTTVMAMLIGWQTVNAVRSPTGTLFSRGFLIIAPGITIRDRLRVLLPDDPENYYRTRELLPPDMLGDIAKAKIVISNFHAFKRRETMDLSKVGRALLQGRGEAPQTIETEGQMLQRACGELMALKNVVALNDEGTQLDTAVLEAVRPSSISYHLAKHLLYTRFRDPGQEPPLNLFYEIQRIVRQWIDQGYLVCKGGTVPAMVTYREMADKAAERTRARDRLLISAVNPASEFLNDLDVP